MRPFLLILLIYWSLSPCLGQVQESKGLIYQKKADSLMVSKSLDSANYYLVLSAKAFLSEGDTSSYFQSQNKKSIVAYDQVNYDGSMLIAQMALEKMQEMSFQNNLLSAEFNRRIGVVQEVRDGDFSKAIDSYNRAIRFLKGSETKYLLQTQLQKDVAIGILSRGYLDSAQVILQATIDLQENDFPFAYSELSDSYRILAITYSMDADNEKALKHYKNALKTIKRDIDNNKNRLVQADIYGNISVTYQTDGYYDSAFYYVYKQKAINEGILDKDHRNLTNLYGNLSLMHGIRGDLDSALFYSEKNLRSSEKKYAKNHPDLAEAYLKTGTLLTQLNRFEEAKVYAEKGLEIFKTSFGNKHPKTYNGLINLGYVHLLKGENNTSLKYYQQALEAYQSGETKQIQSMIDVYMRIADNHFGLGELENALKATQTAHKTILQEFDAAHETAARVKLRFGKYYFEKGDYNRSISEFEKAQELFTQHHGLRNFPVSKSIFSQAEAEIKMGNEQNGILLLQESAIANSYSFNLKTVGENPDLNDMIDPVLGIDIVTQMADAMEKISRKTNDESWLLFSSEQYKASVDLLAELIFETSIESDAMRMLDSFHQSYSDLLSVLTEMKNQGLIKEKIYQEEVLKYSEESRSISLVFNQYKAKKNQTAPLTLDSLKLLNREISFVKSELLTAQKTDTDSVKISYYENKLFELTNSKNILRSTLQSKNSNYIDFRLTKKFQTLDQYQQELSANEAIIEYFVSDTTLFSIVVTKTKIDVISQTLDGKLSDQITDHLAFKEDDIDRYVSGAHQLYKTLILPIEPLMENLEKLIILPEKELWNINFDLLISKKPSSNDPKEFDFLIHKYQISYAYSLDVLFHEKETKSDKGGQMLAFAYEEEEENVSNIFTFRSNDKGKISGTLSEVKGFNETFTGDFYYGPRATEELFKENAKDYSIIHLALHGDVDDTNLNASHLIFNQANESSNQDGYLYPFELYDLELNAEMVVLSACHTGAGEIMNGEGVMSIGRGFLYAGVNSLLLSQWEVSDATAPKIMTSFYEYLNQGHDKDQALRLAKLDFLGSANNITANPHYWGSFFILGDTSSIDLKRPFKWMLWLVIATILLLIIIVGKKKLDVSKPVS